MRYKSFFFILSGLIIVPGLISLSLFGFKPSIDFTGGTLWEIEVTSGEREVISGEIKDIFSQENLTAEVQSSGERRFLIRTAPLDENQKKLISEELVKRVGEFNEIRFETLGPKIGQELLFKALLAVILAVLAILTYIAYRFKNLNFGLAAIAAALHDALIVLGIFSLLGHFFGIEVGTLFITALLTTLAFSVHDTVVVFDRIREIQRKTEAVELEPVINQAIGETLVRSLNNSLTIIFMLVALFALGGEPIRWFVFALLLGMIAGTYSSMFNAAPLLLVLNLVRGKKVESS